MQFGKVSPVHYSFDYDPQHIGVLQAFAIALSTFTSKKAAA